MEIDISKAVNGYIVMVSDEHDSMRYVFNDIEGALGFIKEKFSN